MATIRELNERINLHDLADKLGLERPGNRGNYRSPHHEDSTPSLSIYDNGRRWKDFSADTGGDALDLYCYVTGADKSRGLRELHELYGIEFDKPERQEKPRPASRAEFIAEKSLKNTQPAVDYLAGRGLPPEVAQRAAKARAMGFNDWHSPSRKPGEFGYGGPAAVFITRALESGKVVAVDMRYFDADLNGGVKTQCQGEKNGHPWFMDAYRLKTAKTVYIVESPINALCIEALNLPYTTAVATRGLSNVEQIDWAFLDGKEVRICLDADAVNDAGKRPGPQAAWALYDRLTGLNIAAMMVDQGEWLAEGWNDVNDVLVGAGLDRFRTLMQTLEPWAIQGLPGQDPPPGPKRVWLPGYDFSVYWRFRCKPDFTTYISKVDEDENGRETRQFDDVCGFRVAAVSRVSIASATSTMSGEPDAQPNTVFAVSVQTARHGPRLVRRVMADERLHNVEHWKKFGPIYEPKRFSRLINIMERTADCGARDAVNFVGLAWRNGKTVVNQGPDCYFTDPEKQCPYHNLLFPSGSTQEARRVMAAYQATFTHNAAYTLLVWALGAHLKAFLGFWPHMIVQADKGAGKSTLIKRLERTISMTVFGGQSLQTDFRLLTSLSHTSHPIGWEELSTRKQDTINSAVGMLQEAYQFTVTRRGSEMTEYMQCAPVLLAGEDVPVKSLTGKVVRTELSGRKGTMMPEDLPQFPVLDWLRWLAQLERVAVVELHQRMEKWCLSKCRAPAGDDGARRMVRNYAAVLAAHALLCDFADVAQEQGGFHASLVHEMNNHIADTDADREPFVWILEILLNEIETGQYLYPYTVATVEDEKCIIVRPTHVMDHISTNIRLREKWNGLPVKTARVFKRQMQAADVVVRDNVDRYITVGMRKRRYTNLTAISLERLESYGLYLGEDAPETSAFEAAETGT